MHTDMHLWSDTDNIWLVFAGYSAASILIYISVSHIFEWFVRSLDLVWKGTKERIERKLEAARRISSFLAMSLIFGVGFYLFQNERKSFVSMTHLRDGVAADLATAKKEIAALQIEKDELIEKNKQLETWQEIRQTLLPVASQFPSLRIRIIKNNESVKFARQLAAVLRSIGISVPGDYPYYDTGIGRGIFVIVRDGNKPSPKAQVLLRGLKKAFDRVDFLDVANADDNEPEIYVGYPPQ
ncbi:MAG: hypothetical protein QOJ84_4266 [Bradyrhizobium sp.]|nr:hypothetical protein [Bradyrhizobium sp.]